MSSFICSDYTILAIVDGMRRHGFIESKKREMMDMATSLRLINEYQTTKRYVKSGTTKRWMVECDHREVTATPGGSETARYWRPLPATSTRSTPSPCGTSISRPSSQQSRCFATDHSRGRAGGDDQDGSRSREPGCLREAAGRQFPRRPEDLRVGSGGIAEHTAGEASEPPPLPQKGAGDASDDDGEACGNIAGAIRARRQGH